MGPRSGNSPCVVCGRPFLTNDWLVFRVPPDWRVPGHTVAAHEDCVCELLGRLARERDSGQGELFTPSPAIERTVSREMHFALAAVGFRDCGGV